MQQHPVPQAITTYKFKLVGDMTLKQFLELAAGIVMAWIIYSSKLNFFFKWSLAPFFGFFGFALAFVPIEDRPLDQWIINFFKAIYQPTQFIYRTQVKILDIFKPSLPREAPTTVGTKWGQPYQLEEYLKTLPATFESKFDMAEAKYLEHIASLFGALGVKAKLVAAIDDHPRPTHPSKSAVKGVRVRKLMTPQMCLLPRATVYQAPAEPAVAAMPTIVAPATSEESRGKPRDTVRGVRPPQAKPLPRPKADQPLAEAAAPVFAQGLVLPHAPDKPNLIAGITLDKNGKILPNVILEIKDTQNQPVRALKSNKLGQFFIATPLPDGVYQILAEHLQAKFATIKLEAKNEIIPALKIQAVS